MSKQENHVVIGCLWMSVCFIVLILGCNHLYGYSLLDSILNIIGIGSWTMEGQSGWHITSFITFPLLLLSMIQTARYLKGRYPNIFITLFISSMIWNAVYPKLTERIVSFDEIILK